MSTKRNNQAASHTGTRASLAMCALLALAGALPINAMAAPVTVRVPPQKMIDALSSLAEQLKIQLVYDGKLVSGLTAPAVAGTFEPEEALTRLLAGSGLSFRFVDRTTVTIEKAAQTGVRTLGPIRVEGRHSVATSGVNGSADPTATEGTHSFTTGAMTIGSKTPQSIKDSAQSVSVITAEQIEQQNITDFTQALDKAPGITLVSGGAGGTESNLETAFYSRGFQIRSIQIDGGAPLAISIPNDVQNFFPLIDMSEYDHVELLRGAAGLFNGYGDPSGTINLVHKRPLDHPQVTWEAQTGSWNTYRSVLDGTAPLAFDGRLRGRLVATYQSNDYFYRLASDKRTLLYGVMDYDLTPTTLLTGGVSFTRQDSVPSFGGLPRYENGDDLNLPRSFSYTFPWNRWDFDTTDIFASAEQRLGADWSMKLNLTHNEQDSSLKYGTARGTVNPVTNTGPVLDGGMTDYATEQLSAEAVLSGAFDVLGQRQRLTLGVNRAHTDGGGGRGYSGLVRGNRSSPYQPYPGGPVYCGSASGCPVGSIHAFTPSIGSPFDFDPYAPLYTEPRGALVNRISLKDRQEVTVAYLTLDLTAFDRWHLATGLRFSRYDYNSVARSVCISPGTCSIGDFVGTPGVYEFSNNDFSWPPTVSLSYDLSPDIRLSAIYTDIYLSQAYFITKEGESLGPVTGSNVEASVRWAPHEGRLNAVASVYRIEQKGYAQSDESVPFTVNPANTEQCCYLKESSNTKKLSEGVDLELTGELAPGWQVSAGYTFSRNEYTGSASGVWRDKPFLTRQPEHMLKLWASYDFRAAGWREGWLSNFVLSGGVSWKSNAYYSGSTCTAYTQQFNEDGTPMLDPLGGEVFNCTRSVPYDFAQKAFSVWSARMDYKLNRFWSASLNAENLTDKRYYQTITDVSGGNWYGAPRSYTFSVRGKF